MGTVSWIPLLVALAVAMVAIAALMGVTIAISLRLSNWGVVDTFWGLGFVVIALSSFLISIDRGDPGRRLVALLVPTVWGLRLAGYLHWRNHGKPEDPRYTALLRRRTGALIPFVIKTIFWAQGWVMWVVAIPISVAMFERQPVNVITWIGVALAAIGLFFEAVGDLQLARFRSDPAHAGTLMDRGLWSWTRHPNYFGDLCVMFSLWIIACGSWIGVLTVFAPVLMTRILLTKTGKRMLDRRLSRTRGEAYVAYAARTSGLIPRPPRKLPRPGTAAAPTANLCRQVDGHGVLVVQISIVTQVTKAVLGVVATRPRRHPQGEVDSIDVDGDRAVSEHYVLAMTRVKSGSSVSDSLVASRIIDDLERRDARWGISRRRLRFDWSHDVGEREERWVGGTLDPAALLHGSKYPDDPVYDGVTGRREVQQ